MRLGEILLSKGLITQKQLGEALEEQKVSGDFLGSILVGHHYIRESDLLKVLSEQFHMPSMTLGEADVDWDFATKFSPSLVVDHQCLPIRQSDRGIIVAIVNPLDAEAISRVEEQARGTLVKPVLVSGTDMKAAVKIYNERMSARIKKLLE